MHIRLWLSSLIWSMMTLQIVHFCHFNCRFIIVHHYHKLWWIWFAWKLAQLSNVKSKQLISLNSQHTKKLLSFISYSPTTCTIYGSRFYGVGNVKFWTHWRWKSTKYKTIFNNFFVCNHAEYYRQHFRLKIK